MIGKMMATDRKLTVVALAEVGGMGDTVGELDGALDGEVVGERVGELVGDTLGIRTPLITKSSKKQSCIYSTALNCNFPFLLFSIAGRSVRFNGLKKHPITGGKMVHNEMGEN